nr:hypothetical protein [Tanacetum cinerariifolium]
MNVTPPDAYLDGDLFGSVTNWYPELSIPTHIPDTTPIVTPPVTHLDTTLIPTETLTISPIIPPSPDYTPASPDYLPASDTETDPYEDLSSDHIPPLPATLPFLSLTDDSLDSDTHDTPPSPTYEVGPLPTHRLTVRHSVDYSSSDHFTSDDSLRDSSSSSSSETSSDPPSDDVSDSSSSHSSSDHSLPILPLGTRSRYHLCSLVPSIPRSSAVAKRPSHFSAVGPFRKRSRSPTTSVPKFLSIPGALSPACADLLPPPKRIRSFDFVTYLEDRLDESSESSVPREISLSDDVVVMGIDARVMDDAVDREESETSTRGPVECFAYANSLRDRGIDARVVVEAVDQEKSETGTSGLIE